MEGSVSCAHPEQPWVLSTGASSVFTSFQLCLLGPSPLMFFPEGPARPTLKVLSGQPSPLRVYWGFRTSSREDSDPPDSALRSSLYLSIRCTESLAVCTGLMVLHGSR